ncbi:hypothetical protein BH23BAC4_BH23BAC4_00610 [soil metagenome]
MSTTFADLGLHDSLSQTVAALGYESPTPIQLALIPPMLEGRDVVGQAQTGTGKTAAFALPVIQRLSEERGHIQVLVVVPTRELANQVSLAMHQYGKDLGVKTLPVFGGQPYKGQIDRIRRGVEIVVGTPGRLLDLIGQGALDFSKVSTVILDEADEMLSMGFIEDIAAILDATPKERQTALLSATLPTPIRKLAQKYLNDPVSCTVKHEREDDPDIEHRAYFVHYSDKPAAIARILAAEDVVSAVVFAHTRIATAQLASDLAGRGYSAEALNGEMTQAARTEVLARFRRQQIQLLVATDVAARGLDIDHVSHVINYDVPKDPEIYVHRTGRTGRAGRSGVAIALFTPSQRSLHKRTEAFIKKPIAVAKLPTVDQVAEIRETRFATRLAERLSTDLSKEFKMVMSLTSEGFEPMEIAAAAIAMARANEKETALEQIAEIKERSFSPRDSKPGKPGYSKPSFGKSAGADRGGKKSHEKGMIRLSLSSGRSDGIGPSEIVSAIARGADIPGRSIGKISIQPQQTFVDVPEELATRVLGKTRYQIGKHKVTVEKA